MSKGQFCVYLSKDQSKQLKSFIYESKIFNKTQLDALFDVLPNNYLEIMMSVLQTTYRRPLDINNSIDKSIIKDYIINKYNELNNKESEDDSSIEYYTTGEVVSNEEVESLRDNGAGVFQSFLGNVNNNLISFRRAVFENARKQGIEITDKKDSDFYKFITSLSDSIIRKLMKEGKIITIRPDENLNTNMAVQVNGDVITITYNPLLVVRDADKFDAIISHELLHTVTAAAVNNTQHNIANEEEQQFTQEIFDIIKDLATNENFYWDMNIDINSMRGKYKYIKEFIANVMSNEELREHLSKLKYQQNNNDIAEEEKTSVLTKVFKSIYNYIKSFYSKDTDKELDTTYLEKLTNIIQSHIDTQPSNTFSTLSQYTEGTITSEYEKELQLILLNSPRDKEGRLLAPNGNPTNLTERQYAQVRTKAFKDWFGEWEHPKQIEKTITTGWEVSSANEWLDGSTVIQKGNSYFYVNNDGTNIEITKKDYDDFNDGKHIILNKEEKIIKTTDSNYSKVLDENGEPLVMYHRSDNNISIFDINKSRHGGFWFSKNPNYYADTKAKLKYAIPVFLNIRTPNNINHELFLAAVNGDDYIEGDIKNTQFDGWITKDEHIPEFYGDDYSSSIVFAMVIEPNQIKSATDNVGTFSKTNNRVDQYTEGKVGDASSVKFDWDYKANNNYEVSSKKGDERFSAFNAIFKEGTIIDGVNVGGRTIEDVYQSVIKKSRKGQAPSKDSKLYRTSVSSYTGDITPDANTIFVFGSNPEGRHGAGAAKVAREKFGAIYGQGEGLQGNAYALPTKDLRVTKNRGLRSISESQIIENIKKLYETARQNPDKQFKVAYRNTDKASLNGYTGLEMIDMFLKAGSIPTNIVFSKEWVDTGRFNLSREGLEDFSYTEGYLPLWQEWAKQNPGLIDELRIKAKGKTLTDQFANTRVNQARALADILNQTQRDQNQRTKGTSTITSSNLSKNYYIKDKNLTITASSSVDYKSRTIDNIEQSDVTIALASNFKSLGEKLTKKEAESRNKYVSESIGEGSNKSAKEIAESIFNQIKKLGIDTSKPVDLNIAGNGIYQKGMPSQEDVDTLVTDILRELQKLGLQIKSVRSGGQTGVDEAGVKASLALGLPTIIHGTKDFKFRKEAAKDISDKIDQYLKRFNVSDKDIKGVIENKVEQSKKTTSNKTGLTKEEREKQEKEKQKKEKEAALKSYNTEAPSLHIKIDKSKLDSILINNIPNLAQRVALEKAVYHLFNNYWDFLLQEVRENRETIQDENLAKIYDYILKGSQEEQKLKLLNSLTYVDFVNKNGSLVETKMNPIEYLRNLILKDIINLSMATSQSTKTNSRGEQTKETIVNIDNANAIINYYLVELDKNGNIQYDSNGIPKFKRNTPFGESFYLKYGENNQYLNLDLKVQAVDFIKTLSMQIQPLTNEETFDALFVRSQRLLKHNDNIKISFLNKGSFINKSEDNLNEPEEEDRSGLNLVKFKTLEPSKRMSQRVRKILSQTPRYLNNKIQFNSLGLVEYLSPDIAYYQLVDKFAAIKNEQDYNNLINSLQEEYPWFKFIKEKLDEDEIFRNDFYSAFRNTFNRFAIINERGKISYLNGEAAIDILIDDLQSTYESGLLLNEYSIYKSDTTPNIVNINNFRNNVLQGLLKGFSSNFSALKTAKEKNTLTNEIPTQIATLLKQLFILSEYRIKQENSNESIPLFDSTISLKAILNTFGVSTDKLDLSHLYTSFEDIIEYINSREEFKNNPINIEDFLNVILNTQNATETDKVKALSEYIADKEGLIEAFIDYFTQSSIQSKISKLSSMLKAMSVIVNSKTGFINDNTNLIQSFYKQYLTILSPLKDTTEIYGTTTFQFGNKPRPSYSAPSYASDILRHLNTIETQEDLDNFRTWVQQEFTQFDFYKDSKGECNHLWIKTLLDFIGPKGKEKPIEDIKEFARNFDYVEILGIGGSGPENTIGKINTSKLLNSLIPAAFNVPYSSEQSFGYFRNPLYSDKDVLVLFKAPMFRGKDFKDKVINQLYKVWEAEYDRINFYVTRHNFKNKNNSIEGLEKTGDKFHFFPEFNNEDFFNNLPLDDAEREEYVKENLRQLLESKFESFFAATYSDAKAQQIQDIIEGNSRKDKSERIQFNFEYEEESLKDDESKESNEEEKEQQQDEVLRSLYEQFYYNDFMNYIESIRLFQGDPALYGNSVALVKRGAQSHVFGQRGYFIDENGNPITERCMYIEDYYADSNSMANVMSLLKQDAEIFSDLEKGMIEGLIRKTANYYKDICTTDGQSFRTVDSMKKILKGFGKLTPEIEESLDRIQSGTMNAEDIMKVINNLKPFLYSNESRILKAGGEEQVYERNEKVITQHKNSEYALSALYSILNTALNKSNALKGLQKFMNDNDIDVAHFKSVVKVGANNLFDLNNVYNSKLDEILKTNSSYYTYDEKENKLYLNLPLKVSKEENEIKIEVPLEMQEESPAEKYKYIRELLKINIEKDISLSQQELNHKQKVYNAFQRQYGLESLPEDEVVSILNSQLHTDEEGNTSDSIPNANKIHIFKLQDYVLVQPVDDHYLDHEAIFGSQLRNIVPANLPDNFTCTLRIKGKEIQLNKEQTIQLYNTLITDQLLDSYNINLRRKFTSIKEFKKYVDNLIAINDKYGEDIQNALQLDESGTDFRIPFTSPNLANKIDEIILSAAKNAIQRQKIKGGNIVLISNFGFTSDLHVTTETIEVTDKNGNKTEQKRIKYIPCYAPMSMMQIYKDYLQEEDDGKGNIWYTIDFEKLKKDGNIDHKFLDMIGYRIPSENNYSIMPIRIVGILPQSMGSSIMLPHDIITMSGTDFKQYWSL